MVIKLFSLGFLGLGVPELILILTAFGIIILIILIIILIVKIVQGLKK